MASRIALLLLLLQALIVTRSRAELIVIDLTASESKAAARIFITSKYVYYGSEFIGAFNGSAIWVHGADICTKSLPDISGKLVVTVWAQTTCLMGNVYERINAGGALALLELVHWNPPGVFAYRHHTWDPHLFSSHLNIAWLAVSDPDGSLWQLGAESIGPLHLQVEPPHNDALEAKYRYFDSPLPILFPLSLAPYAQSLDSH
jgi:hypothetical protein